MNNLNEHKHIEINYNLKSNLQHSHPILPLKGSHSHINKITDERLNYNFSLIYNDGGKK